MPTLNMPPAPKQTPLRRSVTRAIFWCLVLFIILHRAAIIHVLLQAIAATGKNAHDLNIQAGAAMTLPFFDPWACLPILLTAALIPGALSSTTGTFYLLYIPISVIIDALILYYLIWRGMKHAFLPLPPGADTVK